MLFLCKPTIRFQESQVLMLLKPKLTVVTGWFFVLLFLFTSVGFLQLLFGASPNLSKLIWIMKVKCVIPHQFFPHATRSLRHVQHPFGQVTFPIRAPNTSLLGQHVFNTLPLLFDVEKHMLIRLMTISMALLNNIFDNSQMVGCSLLDFIQRKGRQFDKGL